MFLLLLFHLTIIMRKMCLLSLVVQEKNETHQVEQSGPARLNPNRPILRCMREPNLGWFPQTPGKEMPLRFRIQHYCCSR